MKTGSPEIFAKKNKFAVKFFDWAFKKLLEKNFYAVRIKNKHNFYLRDVNYANLLYGLHSCWWDGILASFICRNIYNCNFYMMVKDLYRLTALSFIGAFSIEKESFRGSFSAINYGISLLKDPENSLWIFPQGNIMPPDYRPIKFEKGLTYICKRLDGVNLIPIAYRYVFLRKEKPEIFIETGKPIVVKGGLNNKNDFLNFVQEEFQKLADSQRVQLANGDYEGYESILNSDYTWLKMMEDHFKPLWRAKFYRY